MLDERAEVLLRAVAELAKSDPDVRARLRDLLDTPSSLVAAVVAGDRTAVVPLRLALVDAWSGYASKLLATGDWGRFDTVIVRSVRAALWIAITGTPLFYVSPLRKKATRDISSDWFRANVVVMRAAA